MSKDKQKVFLASLREMDLRKLQDELFRTKKDQISYRFQRVNGQVEDFSVFRAAKKSVARILTVMQEKKGK